MGTIKTDEIDVGAIPLAGTIGGDEQMLVIEESQIKRKQINQSGIVTATTDPQVFLPQYHTLSAGKTNLVDDDTAALQWAFTQAAAVGGTVDLGAGKYRITAPLCSKLTSPIGVIGAGPAQCWIVVDAFMSGDVMSFSNTWYGANTHTIYGGGTSTDSVHGVSWPSVASKKSGVTLAGFSIIGDRDTTETQNGIMFYDRNDAVEIQSLDISFVKGTALGLSGFPSVPATLTACLLRESLVSDCHVRWCGDAVTGRPSVVFNCNSRTVAQAGGDAATIADDANNYNVIRNLKIIFSDGISFQSNCYNLNTTLGSADMSNNWIDLIVDSQHGIETDTGVIVGGMTDSGFVSITNGVLDIGAGVSFTELDGSGTGAVAVGTYLLNASVPSGTYISAILTGSGGVGTYQLANRNIDLSAFSVVAGTLGACRYSTPCVQFGGGHAYDRYDLTLNQSILYGSASIGVEFNQNPLGANSSKMRQCKMDFSCGTIDQALFFTVIASLHIDYLARGVGSNISVLNITQNVTVSLLSHVVGYQLNNISGPKTNLHVYPGGQKVITAATMDSVLDPVKWPNCIMTLNNGGKYTRYYATTAGAWVPLDGMLAQSSIPMIIPPGTGAAGLQWNGTDGTFATTALPTYTYPKAAFLYFPANQIAGTSNAAGWYYTILSSATAGKVYNNTYSSGLPESAIPTSPTAFTGVTNAAWLTQTTAADIVQPSITLPGGLMGASGSLRVTAIWNYANSGNNKIFKAFLGGSAAGNQFAALTVTTTVSTTGMAQLRNRGSASSQIRVAGGTGSSSWFAGAATASSAAHSEMAIDTSSDQSITLTAQIANAADYAVLEGFSMEVL